MISPPRAIKCYGGPFRIYFAPPFDRDGARSNADQMLQRSNVDQMSGTGHLDEMACPQEDGEARGEHWGGRA